jgi:hypothetical protein
VSDCEEGGRVGWDEMWWTKSKHRAQGKAKHKGGLPGGKGSEMRKIGLRRGGNVLGACKMEMVRRRVMEGGTAMARGRYN